MKRKRVRAGSLYVYRPNLFDVINPPFGAVPNDIVRVVNLPGCPKANTMGMCHIQAQELPGVWRFAGMVCCASLVPLPRKWKRKVYAQVH